MWPGTLGSSSSNLSPVDDDEAGIFTLDGDTLMNRGDGIHAEPAGRGPAAPHVRHHVAAEDCAAHPHNLSASAANIATSLSLSRRDRCLNVMPLFHIHGLVAATLAAVAAGGSVVCAPRRSMDAAFFEWLNDFQPTWYTAVPTMHQEILRRARAGSEGPWPSRLRFIRSSSAALPPQDDVANWKRCSACR